MRGLAAAVLAAAVAAPALGAEAPRRATLREAIAAALATRLDAVVARERDRQARARALQDVSRLLPQVTASLSETRTFKANLAAEGFSVPGFPSLLGPYDAFDARVHLQQTILDWGVLERSMSGRDAARAAAADEQAARESVASAAALAYLEAVRAQRAVAAAKADQDVAESLLALARDRKAQGAATGVDVVRAEARAADASAALLRAQVGEREARLGLERVAGWPLGGELALADDFTAASSSAPALEPSLRDALSGRAEIAAAEARAAAAREAASAALGDRAPSVVLTGDWARSGTVPSDARPVGSVGAAAVLPLFSGGLLQGRQDEAASRRREALAALADVRQQVELDVRAALERLSESAEEERASAQALGLAERELSMAQDRYAAGLGASVDVVEAQAELARARSAEVSALARYHASRVNYAAAVGRAVDFSL